MDPLAVSDFDGSNASSSSKRAKVSHSSSNFSGHRILSPELWLAKNAKRSHKLVEDDTRASIVLVDAQLSTDEAIRPDLELANIQAPIKLSADCFKSSVRISLHYRVDSSAYEKRSHSSTSLIALAIQSDDVGREDLVIVNRNGYVISSGPLPDQLKADTPFALGSIDVVSIVPDKHHGCSLICFEFIWKALNADTQIPKILAISALRYVPAKRTSKRFDEFLNSLLPTGNIYGDNVEDGKLDALRCILYPFQVETVGWMLAREGVGSETVVDPSWLPLPSKLGPHAWHSPSSFSFHRNERGPLLSRDTCSSGGMVCEEMGLGKTVEIIALILHHSAPEECEYAKTTLIITPSTIAEQWLSEFNTHAPRLSVYRYEGVKNCDKSVQEMCQFDVVVTDYDVLRRELHFVTGDSSRSRRHERKYDRLTSPLSEMKVWRVCLDEAQMVDANSNLARVAALISRRYSWAVTGTPISCMKNMAKELANLSWFINQTDLYAACREDSEMLNNFLKIYMRRNTKESLKSKLIPDQMDNLIPVRLSEIERHYYNEHRRKMLSEFNDYFLGSKVDNRIDGNSLNAWLLRLRQTCCHPRIGAYNQAILGSEIITLHDVLSKMVKTSWTSLRSLKRTYFSQIARKGLLLETKKKFEQALDVYQEALQGMDGFSERSKPFTTQLPKPNLPDSAEDEERLEEDNVSWQALRHQILFCIGSVYLEMKQQTKADAFYEKAEVCRHELTDAREEDAIKASKQAKEGLMKSDFETKLVELASARFASGRGGVLTSFALDDMETIDKFLADQISQVKYYRTKIYEIAFAELHQDYSEDAERQVYGNTCISHLAISIGLRRSVVWGTVPTARPADFGPDYLNRIRPSNTSEAAMNVPPEPLTGPSIISSVHGIHRTLLAKIASLDSNSLERVLCSDVAASLKEFMDVQVDLQGLLEQDLSRITRIWNKRIAFYRILQRLSDAVSIPQIDNFEQAVEEVDKKLTSSGEKIALEESKLKYLENLLTSSASTHGTPAEKQTCLICYDDLLSQLSVSLTECGHLFCNTCILSWLQHGRKCPTCNRILKSGDLKRVLLSEQPQLTSKMQRSLPSLTSTFRFPAVLPPLSQSYSSKLDLIITHIKYLKSVDPDFKCLIFSQWTEVLTILESALKMEGIMCLNLTSNSKTRSKVAETFKNDKSISALLMNARSHSSGLTINQASHVILVEPSLNLAIEAQAKGRVHRLGQTKKTFVHAYVVADSIEEEIVTIREKRESIASKKSGLHEEVTNEETIELLNKELDTITLL